MSTSTPVILAYIPVLHEGYRHFISKHPEAHTVYILAAQVAHELRSLQKDVRALPETAAQAMLQALFSEITFRVASQNELAQLAHDRTPIIAPYEDITRHVITSYLPENEIQFDTIFLRWDKEKSQRVYPPSPTDTLSLPQFTNTFMKKAYEAAAQSADWWRQVGAVIVQNGEILLTAYNRHLPNEQQAYFSGDPRAAFSSGIEIELASSIHAEASAIAHAARLGIPLENTELYCTTFPCPPCAKLIAESGIKRLYFAEGYTMLDGEDILKNHGVEIIKLTL